MNIIASKIHCLPLMVTQVQGTIKVEETSIVQEDALSSADIVVAGVPSKDFCIKVR